MMIAAVLPWKSIDASGYLYFDGRWVESDVTTYDSQAQIELCMKCPFADECHDCVAVGKRTRARRRRKKGYLA